MAQNSDNVHREVVPVVEGDEMVRRRARQRARRWRNWGVFRVLFGGGAIPTTLASWTEAHLATDGAVAMEGDGGGEKN